ncbi:hypothetical protein [Streptomyces sp. NPDC058955]|uniref:hypothetical protein n=1 Tax=unclassified Streptomyces TaxID=2593676 RepID=UPI0036471B3A
MRAGWIVLCRVVDTTVVLQVCRECDTVWEHEEPSGAPPFVILEQYLEALGRPPLWAERERWDE